MVSPHDLVAIAAAAVRRGSRTVLWPQPGMGFGNVLYYLLKAHHARATGRDVVVLSNKALEGWRGDFRDALAPLVIARDRVRITDRRDPAPPFTFGRDFSAESLDSFIDDVLFTSPRLAPEVGTALGPADVAVVVRRGDYWSVPKYRARYAFDISAFLVEALNQQRAVGGPVARVHVVSDGLDWCRAHLGWIAADTPLTFAPPTQSPGDQLATLANARRLIVTNTSFGYWGGYLSGRRHRDNHQLIVAPRFHLRREDVERRLAHLDPRASARQLDPRWSIVESIPGGWVEPPADEWDHGAPAAS
ncbi:MAG: alpha-1,2-fucosyltransferase [Phycicoccus sp.]|nr:alpha-1,2-fucosyltransferase [Phycicoccus sp.]